MAQRAVDAILQEARTAVAAGRPPDESVLRARLQAEGGDAQSLERLERVLSVHRARALVEPAVAPAPAPRAPVRAALRTKPTISANMEIRREPGFAVAWDAVSSVAAWEVRISERPDVRADYVVRESLQLEPGVTRVELPLAEQPLRVHVLGRGRDGRLVRRAVVSGLTRDGWNERWQRRASAS
jgi:hypothetical protein